MHRVLSPVIAMSLSLSANAGLIELGRVADIQATPFVLGALLERLNGGEGSKSVSPNRLNLPTQNAQVFARRMNERLVTPQFPIRSALRYSDDTTIVEVDVLLKRPLCIVGADAGSIGWLSKNKAALLKRNAICAVANAEDAAQLERLKAGAAPLPVLTFPIDEITHLHNITQYPVLIVGNRVPNNEAQQ